jgi:hypothetical protein
VNPQTTTTYTVQASGPQGTAQASVTVSVQGGGATPPQQPPQPPTTLPPTTSPANCQAAGYSMIELDHPYTGSISTLSSSGFSDASAVVVVFTVPANKTSGYVRLSLAEAGGTAVIRTVALSTGPCDWNPENAVAGQYAVTTSGQFVAPVGGSGVQPGTTYYFSIKNVDGAGEPTCSSGNCDVVTSFIGK